MTGKKVASGLLLQSGGLAQQTRCGVSVLYRSLNGLCFKGTPSLDRWEVSRRQLGDGHVELAARRCLDWEEWGPDGVDEYRAYYRDKFGQAALDRLDREEAEAREAANRARAGRRAKAKVRHLCKLMGLDTLLTLTYRENMTDPDRAWHDLRRFVRRLRRAIPGFAFVAVPERQQRGAIHWHLAVQRLPKLLEASNGVKVKSFSVVQAIWRRVVGDVDGRSGGNVDVGRRRRDSRKTVHKVAAYLSKYVTKGLDDLPLTGAHRYSSSLGVRVPKPERWEVRAESLAEVCALVYGDAWDGELRLCGAWVCPYGDAVYFAAEALPAPVD